MLMLAFVGLTCACFAQTPPRFGTTKYEDNTGRVLTYGSKTGVVLANTDSITPSYFENYYQFAPLTAAKTLTIKTTFAKLWDKTVLEFISDTLTAGRVVTFQTTSTNAPIVVTTVSGNNITAKKSKRVIIVFVFDGTVWVEAYRAVQF